MPPEPQTAKTLRVVREPQTPTATTEVAYDPQQRAQVRSAVARQIERKTGRPTGDPMTADEARKLNDRIKFDAEQLWDKIVAAYLGRADAALRYRSWDEYCIREFGSSRLRLPREERPEMVASLRQSGLSIRAIASATGIDKNTVQADLAQVSEIHTPESGEVIDAEVVPEPKPIIGRDGKTYPAKPKREPRPKPNPENPPKPEPDSTPAEDNFIATRFTESSVWAYIDAIEDIGLYTGDDIDLVTPLTADDLPEPPKWRSNGGAEFFREQADRLRAALPRIHELIELLERRAKDGAAAGPPGCRDDSGGPSPEPAAAITNTTDRSPNDQGTADCMAAGRREGDKTLRQR